MTDRALYAHLMRRAGFGASIEELDALTKKPYEEVVEDLLNPERFPDDENRDIIYRFHGDGTRGYGRLWWHRMLSSKRPLEQRMFVFWHYVFATGSSKGNNQYPMFQQFEKFRKHGMGDLRTLLVELSRDPMMIFWLDNNENLKDELNENYGRELLELFSMGVGNYTEDDVKAAAQAFTGWTFEQHMLEISSRDQGYPAAFRFDSRNHNYEMKTFLGETGRFNGEDVVDIIARQPATARFIARQMYAFFVADEPAVAAWNEIPPSNPEAIDALVKAYFASNGSIKEMLRVLFNSDFFKNAQFARVKMPLDLIMNLQKLVGDASLIDPGFGAKNTMGGMGQSIGNPQTVEGWPRGVGWIDGGTLNTRVNTAVEMLDDINKPGLAQIYSRLAKMGPLSPRQLVDKCIEYIGPAPLGEATLRGLMRHAEARGTVDFSDESKRQQNGDHLLKMLQLTAATREYQLS
ncbi:MAG: DUF1800 domain-containing protein [SAR202 cluster bacterium]|nr:DUF1800 domain-containing protein [SAR202 cluster bacterium]